MLPLIIVFLSDLELQFEYQSTIYTSPHQYFYTYHISTMNKSVNKIYLNITEKNVVSMDINLYIMSYKFFF